MSSLAAGVLGIALFGAAWLAGVVGSLGSTFNLPTLRTLGSIGRILLPTDGLWHGAIFALERPSVISLQLSKVTKPIPSSSRPDRPGPACCGWPPGSPSCSGPAS